MTSEKGLAAIEAAQRNLSKAMDLTDEILLLIEQRKKQYEDFKDRKTDQDIYGR